MGTSEMHPHFVIVSQSGSPLGSIFLAFNIKSFKDSQMVHLAKTYLLFYTSTFRCFFFFNWFITYYEILPTCNSFLTCKCEEKPNIRMTNKNIKYLVQFQLMSRPRQGLAKVRAKSEAWESHFMFMGV
jgi:hypothetical protein